jgi:arginase family enzyme
VDKKAKIFGAALDFLDDPERVGLKRSYVEALSAGRLEPNLPLDPYELIAPTIAKLCGKNAELCQKIDIPGWLTPRPLVVDLDRVRPEAYGAFMDERGYDAYIKKCEQAAAAILPDLPVMIGVDHALSAGSMAAVSAHFGPESLAVLVLDSHFDALPAKVRAPEGSDPGFGVEGACGDFLGALLKDRVVLPDRLFVAGVSDQPPASAADTPYGREYGRLVESGVRIYSKEQAGQKGFYKNLCDDLAGSGARVLYISLDADVGSCASIYAVRFLDFVGVNEAALMEIAGGIRGLVDSGRIELGGLDVCEVDVHLCGIPDPEGRPDRTAEICALFMAEIIGRQA